MQKFEILSREMILDNQWLPVEKQIVRLPNGEEVEWFVSKSSDAVFVIPVLASGEILMQRNYKHGCGEIVIEFCAGLIDKGENSLAAAKRELLEETGYAAKQWKSLGTTFANPTGSIMRYHMFLAQDAAFFQEHTCEASEQIETFLVPDLAAAEQLLLQNSATSSVAALAAITFARQVLST